MKEIQYESLLFLNKSFTIPAQFLVQVMSKISPKTQQGSNSQTKDQYQAVREDFLDLLDQHITEAEYCRHVLIELDYSQTQSQTELIGECQESASDTDKKRWN